MTSPQSLSEKEKEPITSTIETKELITSTIETKQAIHELEIEKKLNKNNHNLIIRNHYGNKQSTEDETPKTNPIYSSQSQSLEELNDVNTINIHFSIGNFESIEENLNILMNLLEKTSSTRYHIPPNLVKHLCNHDSRNLIKLQKKIVFRRKYPDNPCIWCYKLPQITVHNYATINKFNQNKNHVNNSINHFNLSNSPIEYTITNFRDTLPMRHRRLLDFVYYALEGKYPSEFKDVELRDLNESNQSSILNILNNNDLYYTDINLLYQLVEPDHLATNQQILNTINQDQQQSDIQTRKRKRITLRMKEYESDSISFTSTPSTTPTESIKKLKPNSNSTNENIQDAKFESEVFKLEATNKMNQKLFLNQKNQEIISQNNSKQFIFQSSTIYPSNAIELNHNVLLNENISEKLKMELINIKDNFTNIQPDIIITLLKQNLDHFDIIIEYLNIILLPDPFFVTILKEFIQPEYSYRQAFRTAKLLLAKTYSTKKIVSRIILGSIEDMCREHPRAFMDAFLIPMFKESIITSKTLDSASISLSKKLMNQFPVFYLEQIVSFLVHQFSNMDWSVGMVSFLCLLLSHESHPLTSEMMGQILIFIQDRMNNVFSKEKAVMTEKLILILVKDYPHIMKPYIKLLESIMSELDDDITQKIVQEMKQLK